MANQRTRLKLCRNYALGNCPQGAQCRYIHSDHIHIASAFPLRQREPFVTSISTGMSPTSPIHATSPSAAWPLPPLAGPMPQIYSYSWNYHMPQTMPVPPVMDTRPVQYRPLSWRTTLCRHFAKNQGWCPLGDECGYIHDLQLASHARNDERYPNGSRPFRPGLKQSHCWAFVQGMCRVNDCPYFHPASKELFKPHTPCLAWPNCERGALCPYKHPEPFIPKLVNFSAQVSQQPVQDLSPIQTIPHGTVQVGGTTYFPVSQDVAALPEQGTQLPVPYSPVAASIQSAYSPYSNASAPYLSPVHESNLVPPLVSFASISSVDANRYTGMPPVIPVVDSNGLGDVKVTDAPANRDVGIETFPFRPPSRQRSGHARRVSVTLKSKEDSDALTSTNHSTARRQPWMTHSKRDAETRRSWPWTVESAGSTSTAPQVKMAFGT